MPLPSSKSLRILTITHNYPRFSGDPAGAFVARIAEGAAAQGHQVEVIAPHTAGTMTDERIGGIRLHRFRYAPESLERVAYGGSPHQAVLRMPLLVFGIPAFLAAFAHAVRSVARRLQPDLVHAHWWFPGGWLASRARRPYVLTCHGSDVRLLDRGGLVRATARGVFQRAARVTTVSNFLAQDVQRLLPGIVPPPVVTPMPIDANRFLQDSGTRKAEPPRILFAGNLVPSKGVDLLLRAVAELKRRGVPCQLRILGDGSARNSLETLCRELDIGDRVTWASFVPQSEMPQEYAAATVTALPSRAEGLGLTLVEALLAGSAVVGTSVGGIPEVIRHQETGLLARDGDPLDLASQLSRLLADPALRDHLTRAGKEHVLRIYAPEPALQRFLDLYHAVADHQPYR